MQSSIYAYFKIGLKINQYNNWWLVKHIIYLYTFSQPFGHVRGELVTNHGTLLQGQQHRGQTLSDTWKNIGIPTSTLRKKTHPCTLQTVQNWEMSRKYFSLNYHYWFLMLLKLNSKTATLYLNIHKSKCYF